MRTVKEVSRLTGISVRMLHHYDAIGLLKPAKVTEAGYRLYDDAALERIQSILMFRQLQFPLKEIKAILDNPDYDPAEAVSQQIRLLELQLEHIKNLISLAREIQRKGVGKMNFQVFDTTEMEQYAAEVKERWGATEAYKEYAEKTKGVTREEMAESGKGILKLFEELGRLRNLSPDQEAVQEKVKQLQEFITNNYYNCTDEILEGLSRMYVEDERMKGNIDRAGGRGTAEFARQAILIHVQ